MEQSQEKRKQFDIVVTHRDPVTGVITKQDPYIMRVVGEQGSDVRSKYWERPAGSGNLFDSQGNPIGRWEYEDKVVRGKKIKQGKFVEGAEHIKYTPPETKDQKLARELASQAAENETLRKELALLKAEQEKTTKNTKAPVSDKK